MKLVRLLGSAEIDLMRVAGQAAAELLALLGAQVRSGITTSHLDDLAVAWAVERGHKHAPFGYRGFPRSICTSANSTITHGIPSAQDVLQEGDIVNCDVTPIVGGYCGDTSQTFRVGKISDEAEALVETTNSCLAAAIAVCKPGAYFGDIGAAIQKRAKISGFSVVSSFTGHFIGRQMHISPSVLHVGVAGTGMQMEPGMVFTIEPMINAGGPETRIEADGWTVRTIDGRWSAQCEHTVAIVEDGVEVLTRNERLGF